MSNPKLENLIRLFGMSTLQIKSALNTIEKDENISLSNFQNASTQGTNQEYYQQIDFDIRQRAKTMALYYEIFYCLENTIRKIIREVLSKKFETEDWWEKGVDKKIRDEVDLRIQRDLDSSFSLRSDDNLDFANFGELTNIIERQWDSFNDLFTSQRALKRVMSALNVLRGPIAHCSELAEDEVKRLELTIKDLFRLMS